MANNSKKPGEDAPRELQAPSTGSENDLPAELKKGLEGARLSPELKAQILAELPSPEEREKMLRELIEKGGLTSAEFLTSLGLDLKN